MKRFFKGLKRVYVGWKNVIKGNLTDEAKRRLEICMNCDNKIRVSQREYICRECGCIIRAKCASPEEICNLNKG